MRLVVRLLLSRTSTCLLCSIAADVQVTLLELCIGNVVVLMADFFPAARTQRKYGGCPEVHPPEVTWRNTRTMSTIEHFARQHVSGHCENYYVQQYA